MIKGLSYSETVEAETTDSLKANIIEVCKASEINLNVGDILHAERARTGPPLKPVFVTFKDENTRLSIMRSKSKLRTSDSYKSVYIEPFKNRNVRALEGNIRKIANAVPGLEFKHGRVQQIANGGPSQTNMQRRQDSDK